ncbi:hypothetical protein J7E96_06875 [Streptomyces sp. ISL-96]|uniref:hypothetical protein n=1 Tax=Streptomyces sp. ISL-96 TaxID=2819191 RepID=UPI001BEBC174|nr:hypothetical protein [Streptomyces sp. ISL-96]MBT2488249.1 hypothetical protein [Streptomyces sp. ISL-96]
MRSSITIRRAAMAAAVVASLSLINAPSASANWTSYINDWTDGDESRRWADESYSQVQFTTCDAQNGTEDSVVVKMWKDVSYDYDTSYGSKTFTKCFTAGETSNGEWTGLPTGNFYFEAAKVAQGGKCCLLNVDKVYVDTTQAD